jgi:glycosyltransferase involved in cell wall biosynthesis
MSKGISVIICCYNSSKRLPTTLKYLCDQEAIEGLPWEIIIVNNNSSDNTPKVAEDLLVEFNCTVPFSIVHEKQAGLSYARNKGIETAQFSYVIFCDDDNWLAPDYIQNAYDLMENMPEVGVLGGQGKAVCECPAPIWLEAIPGIFAVGKPQKKTGYITASNGILFGAGMVIRKAAWNHLLSTNYTFYLSDRKGKSLSSGGDSEICLALRLLGYQLYFDEKLVYHHFIPKERLKWEYVTKMAKGLGNSFAYLRLMMLVLKGEELDFFSWSRQWRSFARYVLSPAMVYAYFRALQSKDNWLAVSYPAHFIALKDWSLYAFYLASFKRNIQPLLKKSDSTEKLKKV